MDVLRVIDANLNRANEGLRTIEEVARLVAEDSVSALWAKRLRHRLASVAAGLDRGERLSRRSTVHDPGTSNRLVSEERRSSWEEVITAACERTSQALRVLEETAKIENPNLSVQFKNLRYETYDILAKIELRLHRDRRRLARSRLCVLVDCQRPVEAFAVYVRRLVDAGVDMVQLRDKQADGRRLVEYGRACRKAIADTQAVLIINDRADVAVACRADGIHVGQDDLPIEEVRRFVPPSMWIGVSTHSVDQAIEAEEAGADYIGCGPTFPSQTKQFTEFPGTSFLMEVGQAIHLPYFAIGGITINNLSQVIAVGCHRVAVSHCVHGAADPSDAVRRLRGLLDAAAKVADEDQRRRSGGAPSVRSSD
ncbi:MAG: thiamine-phosphate synthase [Pirellulaceae bacterium]|nr:MAG: thiamine-phosphate synthase [Pirellulaceae bacterium]